MEADFVVQGIVVHLVQEQKVSGFEVSGQSRGI